MPPESDFDEVVLFEVPPEQAECLVLRLRRTRLAWLLRTDDGFFVIVALRVERDDVALLLRDVQAWLADVHLPYLPFVLDGRGYELREPTEALSGHAV